MKIWSALFLLLVPCQLLLSDIVTHPEPQLFPIPPVAYDSMYILKDAKGIYYYTQDNIFTGNQFGNMVSPDGFLLQGFGIDQNFNIDECSFSDIHIPIGSLTTAQQTSIAHFIGDFSAIGMPALDPYDTPANLRAVHYSQILNTGGADITGSTLLADVESHYGPLFDIGNIINMANAQKGSVTLPEKQFLVQPDSTVDDLLIWMQGALGIHTDGELSDFDLNGNGEIDPFEPEYMMPRPGVRIVTDPTATDAQTCIEIVSNIGEVNALDFNGSEAFEIIQGSAANKYTNNPLTFNEPDGYETADIEGTRTSFTAYDSLGTPIHIDIAFVMIQKTDFGITWRYFAESPDSTDISRAVGTGTIEFDVFGNLIESVPNLITIQRQNVGTESPLNIKLNFSYIDGYSLYPSEIAWTLQDGAQTGTLQDYSIDTDGFISGYFTNGTTRTLGQVAQAPITDYDNLIPYNNDLYIATLDPQLPFLTGSGKVKIHPAIPDAGLYILKDQLGETYYTTRPSFSLNLDNYLVNPNDFILQGCTIDDQFNIIEDAITDLKIPIGQLSTLKSTDTAYFSGDLNAAGISALDRSSGSLDLRADLRGIQNSQILSDSIGADIDNWTLLTDLRDAGYPLFNSGNIINMTRAQKGDKFLPDETFLVETTSTVGDLLAWMEDALGINTSPMLTDLDNDGLTDTTDNIGNPVNLPGVRIAIDPTVINAQTYIEVISNMGPANEIDFGGAEAFEILQGTAANIYCTNPFNFADPDGYEIADIEDIKTSFTAFDSLGTPINIDITLTMLDKTDHGITWLFFAESPDNTDHARVVGTGTITFDPNGNFKKASNTTIAIDRQNTGAFTPLFIDLDFSNVDGYAINYSRILLLNQNGFPTGILNDYAIGDYGIITGLFSNGMTQPLGQVMLASFLDFSSLEYFPYNLYTPGPYSTTPYIHKPAELLPGAYRDQASDLSINGDAMFVLKDSYHSEYYTSNGRFRLNQDNKLSAGNDLIVQGYPAGYSPNNPFNTTVQISDLTIPLGQTTAPQKTTNAAFAGTLNSNGLPAVSAAGITPNLRGIQNSQILNESGADITGTTPLIYLEDANGPIFEADTYLRMANVYKGGKKLPQLLFQITPYTTVDSLIAWLNYALAINTSQVLSDLDHDGTTDTIDSDGGEVKQPGIRIATDPTSVGAQTYIEVVSNMGRVNQIDFDFEAFELVSHPDSDQIISYPLTFAEPDRFTLDDVESVATSFRAYNPAGTPMDIDIRLVMQEKTNDSTTWRLFAEFSDPPASNKRLAGTGTISFDSAGRIINSFNIGSPTTTINVSGSNIPHNIVLDFSNMSGSAMNSYSAISLLSQNGFPSGILSDYYIDIEGVITGVSTNGQTKPLGQIALASLNGTEPADIFTIDVLNNQHTYNFCPCVAANINQTGSVDLADFQILASQWQRSGMIIYADINHDQTVDLADLQLLINCWLNE